MDGIQILLFTAFAIYLSRHHCRDIFLTLFSLIRFASIFFFFLLFIYCQSPSSFSQEIKGSISGSSLANTYIYLWEYNGNHTYLLDSAMISSEGKFYFPAKIYPAGYYFLSADDSGRADLILNPAEKEVILEFTDSRLQQGIRVVSSEENKLLWEYKLISKSVYNELKNIYIEKSYIPVPPLNSHDSLLLSRLQRTEDSLNDYKQQQLRRICESAPETFFARSARPSLRKKYHSREEEKKHFFETVDFTDASLIRSNVFPMNMMDYLQKYTEYSEEGFNASVDTILSKAKVNDGVYEFCFNYLLELFDKVGPDVVFQHLMEKYLAGEGCSDVNVGKGFKEKAEAYRMLLPGNKSPDVIIPDLNGLNKNIKDLVAGNELSLLFFWSSHCQFCHKAVADIKNIYANYHGDGFDVIAISLDENKSDWEKYISGNKLSWINLCDFKGWKSMAVEKYKVHKTPSFYLLDGQMTILSKPASSEELEKAIKRHLNF